MRNRFISLIAAILAATALWAYDFKEGDLCYNIIGKNTAEVSYQTGGEAGVTTDATEPISSTTSVITRTQTKFGVRFTYDWGDADNVEKYGYEVIGTSFVDTLQAVGTISEPIEIDTLVTGLTPNTEYTFRTFVETRDSISEMFSEDFSHGIGNWEKVSNSGYPKWGLENGACTFSCHDSYGYSEARGWLVHPVRLIGGVECQLRILVKRNGESYWTTPEATIGIGEGKYSIKPIITCTSSEISTTYKELTSLFTPAKSGVYYIGLYCKLKKPSRVTNTLYFDDISIVPSIGKIPTIFEKEQKFSTLPIIAGISCTNQTQTTLSLLGNYDCGNATNIGINGIQYCAGDTLSKDYSTIAFNKTDSAAQEETTLTGLQPNTTYCARTYVVTVESDTIYSNVITCTTKAITSTTTSTKCTQTKLGVSLQYDWGDVDRVKDYGFEIVGTSIADTFHIQSVTNSAAMIDTLITGLAPNTEYTFRTFVERQDSIPIDSIVFLEDFSNGMDDWGTYISERYNDEYGNWRYSNGECVLSTAECLGGWLTHAISLTAGVEYTFQTRVRKYFDFGGTARMAIGIGNSDSPSSMTAIASKESFGSVDTGYVEVAGTFTPVEEGTYYVGLYGLVSPVSRQGAICFKELSVSTPYSQPRKRAITISTNNEHRFTTLPVSASILCNNRTQTTLSVRGSYDCGDATNTGRNGIQYCEGTSFGDEYTTIAFNRTDPVARLDTIVTGLKHYTIYSLRTYVVTVEGDTAYSSTCTYCTLDMNMSFQPTQCTQTKVTFHTTYDAGDLPLTNSGIQYCVGSSFSATEAQTSYFNHIDSALKLDTIVTGLTPNTGYTARGFVTSNTEMFDTIRLISSFEDGNLEGWDTNNNHLNCWKTNRVGGTYAKDRYDCLFSPAETITNSYLYHDAVAMKKGTKYTIKVKIKRLKETSTNCKAGIWIGPNAGPYYIIDTIISIQPTATETEYIGTFTPKYDYYRGLYITLFAESQVGITFDDVCVTEKIPTYYTSPITFTTKPIVVNTPTLTQYGQTYMLLSTSCNYGDATLVEEAVEYGTSKYSGDLQKASVSNNMVKINNLLPDTRYYYRSLLTTAEGGTIYSDWQEMTTKAITLSTDEADGISAKSVFLHGTIDCDKESRTEIGFEWKRSDAPATVKPQRVLVTDRVDSTLVFRLEGLSKDKYYDYRAFCLYKGVTYYGTADDGREWVTFLTAEDDVLVAPSVQTLEAKVSETGVELRGFVVAGTENIIQKGFESWRKGTTDIATTVSEGAIMTNEIPEPWSYTTYQYRAYAKTPSGTTYGETKEVATRYIHTDIQDVVVTPSATTANVTWTIVEQANYYILTLFGNAEMTDTLATYTVDTEGNITHRRAPAALRALVNCSIDQLTPETDYFFTVIAYNADEKKVAEENGTFTTMQLSTDIEDVVVDEPEDDSNTNHNGNGTTRTTARKVFRDGQVYILRNGKTYTLRA